MTKPTATETELRHAVIDRLIAASLREVAPAREADIKTWRMIAAQPPVPVPGNLPPDLTHL
jgi:hypothetical protein